MHFVKKKRLLKDLDDTCLLIESIGRDMISDAVCNILRGPLTRYTQHMCQYYDVLLTSAVDSSPIWNPITEVWESALLPLPMTSEGKIILVPNVIVRHRLSYQYDEYYTHYSYRAASEEWPPGNQGLLSSAKACEQPPPAAAGEIRTNSLTS
jgi:hypothetical protein